MKKIVLTFIIFFYFTEKSFAYLGPGLAFGALATILAFLGSIFIIIYGIFIKILKTIKNLKKNKKKKIIKKKK